MRSSSDIVREIESVSVLIDNAITENEIQAKLEVYGYTLERLNEGKSLLTILKEQQHQQKADYGQQFAATDAFQGAREVADKTYRRYHKVAQVAFRNNRSATQALGLNNLTKTRVYSQWLDRTSQFYANLLADNDLLAGMTRFGVTREQLEAGKSQVDATENARKARELKKGGAQSATSKRNTAYDNLNNWLSEFRPIVEIALEDEPQLLEKLGISQ